MLLATYMETCTNFFETVDLKECLVDKFTDPSMSFNFDVTTKRGKKLYVGSMILRHSLQMLANAYAVVRLVETSPSLERETFVEEQQRIAAGAYPSASMLNHSCDPSVIHTYVYCRFKFSLFLHRNNNARYFMSDFGTIGSS